MRRAIAILSVVPAFGFAGLDDAQFQSLESRAMPFLETAKAAGNAFVNVSAASGMPNLAAESVAAAFGSNLASRTETGTAPYPTSLGGVSMQVVDNTGSRFAQLLYVSSTQINYIIPAGTAPGTATFNIINGSGTVLSSTGQIQKVAPALFTANANGQGVVAATAYATVGVSTRAFPVQVYQCGPTPGSCTSVPMDVGVDTPLSVTLYATGLRGRSSDSAVTVVIAGKPVAIRSISSFDAANPFDGIDAVTITGLLSYRGSGEVDIILMVDGATSNTARINFQ